MAAQVEHHQLDQASNAGSLMDPKRGGWITFPFVTVGLAGITLATSGCYANLIVYLIQQFNIGSIDAAQISNIVNGCVNLAPVAGAIIADSFFGAFSVISISSSISLLGAILFLLTAIINSLRPTQCQTNIGLQACERPSAIQFMVLYTAMALVAIGVGGTRATTGSFGADQYDRENQRNVFFNWFFFTNYVANTIGYTVIVFIQDHVGWSWGYGAAAGANAIGLAVFLMGNKYYCFLRKSQQSPFTSVARVVVAAICKTSVNIPAEKQEYYCDHDDLRPTLAHHSAMPCAPSSTFGFLNCAALKTENSINKDGTISKSWRLCTVQEVEDLKSLIKLFPQWASCVFVSVSIAIVNGLVVLQALTMNRHIGPNFQVPAGSFFVFLLISTAVFLSIYTRFILPIIQRLVKITPTTLQHIGIGHVINIFGMALFAVIESRRLHLARSHLATTAGAIVPMSALWLVIPLAVVGIGESFHYPGQVMFYYQEFPISLRSTATAMTSVLVGVGFYLSTAVVDLIRKVTDWVPDNNDINKGRLDNVFWFLTVACLINFGFYVVCSIMYKNRNADEETERNSNGAV